MGNGHERGKVVLKAEACPQGGAITTGTPQVAAG